MEQVDTSKFRVYSYGYVADNKPLSSKVVNVTPVEIVSMIDGELASNPKDIPTQGVDREGKAYTGKVTNDSVIECTWLPFGTNRVTPPDVRRGEPVLIWVYESVDKYYWTTLGLRDDLRRLETVIYAFNANPNVESQEFNPENFYFVEVSTHSQQITLRTSNKNGEPFKYAFQFNTKEGIVTLADDTDNTVVLNSKEISLKMDLNTGTKVHLDKMNILIEAIEEAKMKVGDTTITMTPASIINKCGATEQHWLPDQTILKTPQFLGIRT